MQTVYNGQTERRIPNSRVNVNYITGRSWYAGTWTPQWRLNVAPWPRETDERQTHYSIAHVWYFVHISTRPRRHLPHPYSRKAHSHSHRVPSLLQPTPIPTMLIPILTRFPRQYCIWETEFSTVCFQIQMAIKIADHFTELKNVSPLGYYDQEEKVRSESK